MNNKTLLELEKIFLRPISDKTRLISMLQIKLGENLSCISTDINGKYHKAKLLKELKDKYGNKILDYTAEHDGQKILLSWKRKAIKNQNTIQDLIRLLWEPFRKNGGEYTFVQTEKGIKMSCTRCPYYEAAKTLGYAEEAFYMFCTNDFYITEGFNPNIGFERTKTLMEGHDCCDHFYFMKE